MYRHSMKDYGEQNPRQAAVDRTRDATVASMNAARSASGETNTPRVASEKKEDEERDNRRM